LYKFAWVVMLHGKNGHVHNVNYTYCPFVKGKNVLLALEPNNLEKYASKKKSLRICLPFKLRGNGMFISIVSMKKHYAKTWHIE